MARGRLPEVAAFLRKVIAEGCERPEFRDLVTRLLARPGRVLSGLGPARWPGYVLSPCQALGGNTAVALGAVAAVEFAMAAGDVVDDVVDHDWEGTAEEAARALNASLGLLALAQRCLEGLAEPLGQGRALLINRIFSRGVLAACDGEDLDLLLEASTTVSEEEAHDMTVRKSGSLIAAACQMGAACATDEPRILELVGTFGSHVGALSQLLNDIAGADEGGSDLQRRKKTLPIAYALRCAREESLRDIAAWYGGAAGAEGAGARQLAAVIRDTGALQYAWVVADVHRREALASLAALAQASGREEVRELRRLVPSVRARRRSRESP